MVTTKDGKLCVWADSFIPQCDANKAAWGVPADAGNRLAYSAPLIWPRSTLLWRPIHAGKRT